MHGRRQIRLRKTEDVPLIDNNVQCCQFAVRRGRDAMRGCKNPTPTENGSRAKTMCPVGVVDIDSCIPRLCLRGRSEGHSRDDRIVGERVLAVGRGDPTRENDKSQDAKPHYRTIEYEVSRVKAVQRHDRLRHEPTHSFAATLRGSERSSYGLRATPLKASESRVGSPPWGHRGSVQALRRRLALG
jgi:hypothetical protein